MGIPKFFRWLSERYPLMNQTVTEEATMPEVSPHSARAKFCFEVVARLRPGRAFGLLSLRIISSSTALALAIPYDAFRCTAQCSLSLALSCSRVAEERKAEKSRKQTTTNLFPKP